jgi:hypothetical protein
MNYSYYARILAIVLAMIISKQVVAQETNCGFQEMLNRQFDEDTSLIQRFAAINLRLEEAVRNDENATSFRNEATIPVVVHVVWNSLEENVSDLTIVEQIAILNRDFNGENNDLENTPEEFHPFMAKEGIRFCLAAVDPLGMPTSGIVRVNTEVEAIGTKEDLFYSNLGGSDAWDTNKYLNIWIANTGEFITGFGTFPEQTDAERQGVVINPKYFGNNASRRFNLGRIAVHEVGHYLGLNHIWDDNSDCETDDGVDDTPFQQHGYEGCPAYPQSSCGSNDMFMNFMDYVDDDCMVMFTQGQMERMMATIEIFRPGLLESSISCIDIAPNGLESDFTIYPNPTRSEITINFTMPTAETGTLEIYNSIGQLVFKYDGVLRNKMRVTLTELISGVYWVKIGKKGKKLIVL